MEARLSARVVEQVEVKDDTADADAASAERRPEEKPSENVDQTAPPPDEGGEGAPNAWSDEAAESAFRSEARARGESVTASAATIEAREHDNAKPLPALAELVKRLPTRAMRLWYNSKSK